MYSTIWLWVIIEALLLNNYIARLSGLIRFGYKIQINGGIRNLFNSYQEDFDRGPTRDSDFIYGPAAPRTYFVGLKLGNGVL